MIYVTSDLHFSHENIIKFEPISRPFVTVEDMNRKLIENWNSVVTNDDTVYVIGDFFMGKLDTIKGIYEQLNGNVIVVRGNHDTKNRIAIYEELGIPVKDIEYLTYKGRFFILCHFPITDERFSQMVTEQNSEVITLYGHVHSNAPAGLVNNTFHVGVDTNNLTPVSLDYIWHLS